MLHFSNIFSQNFVAPPTVPIYSKCLFMCRAPQSLCVLCACAQRVQYTHFALHTHTHTHRKIYPLSRSNKGLSSVLLDYTHTHRKSSIEGSSFPPPPTALPSNLIFSQLFLMAVPGIREKERCGGGEVGIFLRNIYLCFIFAKHICMRTQLLFAR